jgi:hypothetical protein
LRRLFFVDHQGGCGALADATAVIVELDADDVIAHANHSLEVDELAAATREAGMAGSARDTLLESRG